MHQVSAQLNTIIQDVVETLDYSLWGVQLITQPEGPLLRVYIDSAAGILVDDCAKVSRQLSAVLDVENPLSSHYTLEVSSPGMNRPIFTLAQYSALCGSSLKIKLRFVIDGRKKIRGTLSSVIGEVLTITLDDTSTIQLTFDDIDAASVIPTF
jgi:ribosome maturation factor RimP